MLEALDQTSPSPKETGLCQNDPSSCTRKNKEQEQENYAQGKVDKIKAAADHY